MPRLGIWLSNGLGAFKLILLLLVVCTGFAALAGRTVTPTPGNFSSFHGPGSAHGPGDDSGEASAAGYALALLQVLYSYSGWENANYVSDYLGCHFKQQDAKANRDCLKVLTEVRDAPRTLRRAAPLAAAAITLLYVLANIAYVRTTLPLFTTTGEVVGITS
jgi:amino acid transporter